VILHGLFGSSDNWQGIALKLAERFRVFCLDLRNHGRSPHSAEMNFLLMAEDIAEFLAVQQLADAAVLGHSLGGKAAMQFALTYPEKARALVVVDIAPRAYPPAHTTILEAMLGLDLKAFQTRSQIELALSPAIPDAGTRRFLLKNVASAADGSFHWRLNLRGIHDNYARLNEVVPAGKGAPFAKPALFVRGGRSDYVSDADWPDIQRQFPGSRLATIPDAEHWVHADAPDSFIASVREFLR
jgi:esterase